MNAPRTAYGGRSVTFATMHGKESLARDTFRQVLGANVTAPAGLDTDQWGTFAGDIPRTLSPRDAARSKARMGMHLAGTTLGLASEGSFGAGFGPVVENVELVMFLDDTLGLELVEGSVCTSPLPAARRVRSVDDALDFASALGFPEQGMIVHADGTDPPIFYKSLSGHRELESAVRSLLREHPSVVVMPDHRAHRAPSRALVIRALCERMAHRLARHCPECSTPGFGQVDVEAGAPCAACGSGTKVIAADIHGCGRCEHRARLPHGAASADSRWCDYCNP